jgi:hypothetical protein
MHILHSHGLSLRGGCSGRARKVGLWAGPDDVDDQRIRRLGNSLFSSPSDR